MTPTRRTSQWRQATLPNPSVRSASAVVALSVVLAAACTSTGNPSPPVPVTVTPPATTTPANTASIAAAGSSTGNAIDMAGEIATLVRLADAGDDDAAFTLAERQLHGEGLPQDMAAGIARLRQASAHGHAPSQTLLASLNYRGAGMAVDFAQARALLELAAERRYLPAMNDLAWLLATCPDAQLRDGARAVALLLPVMDRSAQMLDTLAAAHAETGDFTRAVALQEQALHALQAPADPRLRDFMLRMKHYSEGKPWRDPRDAMP